MRCTSAPSAPTSKPSRSPVVVGRLEDHRARRRRRRARPSSRSSQSSHRVRCSAPISSTRRLPVASRPARDPQAVHEAAARRVQVHRRALRAERVLDDGRARGDEPVRRRRREQDRVEAVGSDAGALERRARGGESEGRRRCRRRGARGCRCAPRIHASEVSRVAESSSLVTTRSGSAVPQPVSRRPGTRRSPMRSRREHRCGGARTGLLGGHLDAPRACTSRRRSCGRPGR